MYVHFISLFNVDYTYWVVHIDKFVNIHLQPWKQSATVFFLLELPRAKALRKANPIEWDTGSTLI